MRPAMKYLFFSENISWIIDDCSGSSKFLNFPRYAAHSTFFCLSISPSLSIDSDIRSLEALTSTSRHFVIKFSLTPAFWRTEILNVLGTMSSFLHSLRNQTFAVPLLSCFCRWTRLKYVLFRLVGKNMLLHQELFRDQHVVPECTIYWRLEMWEL